MADELEKANIRHRWELGCQIRSLVGFSLPEQVVTDMMVLAHNIELIMDRYCVVS